MSDAVLHDPLTGLPVRRRLDDALRCTRPLALIVADVDHFDDFNEHHGRAAGDALLRSLARVLCDAAGDDGVVCRCGGDAFVLLLPGVDLDGATQRAQALLREVCRGEAPGVSFGVASSRPGESGWDVLLAADAALHRAKAKGRARVERAVPALAPRAYAHMHEAA